MSKEKADPDWSRQDTDQLTAMYAQGASINEMAARLKRPWNDVMDRLRSLGLLGESR
jgi:hypothetical protein